MTLGEMIRSGAEKLRQSEIENSTGEAKNIAMHLTGFSSSELFMHSSDNVNSMIFGKYNETIEKRSTHYPLQYLLGETCFMGYMFKCREGVLIPRYDTENLVEAAVKAVEGKESLKVLDMCTGTGCIGLAFALERLKQGVRDKITLADISDYAIELSHDNLENFRDLDEKDVEIIKTDLFTELEGRRFNVLLTNPPYIPTAVCEELEKDVRDYEPRLALDGDIDGLTFYKRIISEMGKYLEKDAYILMEIGFDQYESVKKLLIEEGYGNVTLIKDLNGLDRVVICRS
jgi:protein-(glutamine-N5) methyltransferase, release factor-specific